MIANPHGSYAGILLVGGRPASDTHALLLHRMFPPKVTGVQLVPLWKIAGSHTGKLQPGPSRGPVFSGD